jgi:hypothetical protein
MKVKIIVEHWWNGSDRGKAEYWEKNLSQYHTVHRRPHIDWPGIETVPPR